MDFEKKLWCDVCNAWVDALEHVVEKDVVHPAVGMAAAALFGGGRRRKPSLLQLLALLGLGAAAATVVNRTLAQPLKRRICPKCGGDM